MPVKISAKSETDFDHSKVIKETGFLYDYDQIESGYYKVFTDE